MTLSTYPNVPVDTEEVINAIYRAQVSLKLLAEWLARDPEPIMDNRVLEWLAVICVRSERLGPTLRRH